MSKESNKFPYRLVRAENGKLRGVGDLKSTIGIDSLDLLQHMLLNFERPNIAPDIALQNFNMRLGIMYALKPQNELEGMLIIQIVNVYTTALEYLNEGGTEKNLQAVRLLNLFTQQLEMLKKFRREGQIQIKTSEQLDMEAGNLQQANSVVSASVRKL